MFEEIIDSYNNDQYNNCLMYIFNQYNFFNIAFEDFKNKVLEYYSKDYACNGNVSSYDCFNNIAKQVMFEYIRNQLKDDYNCFNTLNNYINYYFKKTSYYAYDILYLKKLVELLLNVSYVPSLDIIVELIKNNKKLNNVLAVIVNSEFDNIEIDDSSKQLFLLFINTYIDVTGIDKRNKDDMNNSLTKLDSTSIYFREVKKIPLLTYQEEKRLAYRMLEGDMDARTKLIEANLRLVTSVARSYLGGRININDLIQAGNEGLIIAANKYDVRKGYRFSTYATWWIFSKIMKDIVKINNLKEVDYEEAYSVKSVFNGNIDNSMENKVILKVLPIEIKHLLNECNLTDKELFVIVKSYGLDGKEPLSYPEIAKLLGNVSRETVRRRETNALMKIRRFARTKEFAVYLDNPRECLNRLEQINRLYDESLINCGKKTLEDMLCYTSSSVKR